MRNGTNNNQALVYSRVMTKEHVVVPAVHNVPGSMRPRYPFGDMDVGDWFIINVECMRRTAMLDMVRRVNGRGAMKFKVEGIGESGNSVTGRTYTGSKVTRVS